LNHYLKTVNLDKSKFALRKLAFLVSAAVVSAGATAGNSWLSKSVVTEGTQHTGTYYSTNKKAFKKIVNSNQTLFDITISLYNSPAGDNDASISNGDEQEVHEEIIGYFADAVCEESNGAHKLRKVSLFKNRKHQAKADIIWIDKAWPRANLAGFGANGAHIYFGDIFPGGKGNNVDLNMLGDTKGAGYTLGHEWGHYAYGLLDEYTGNADSTASASTPQNTDLPPAPSIMNSQWKAKSDGAKWLNHSTSNNFGDPARTAQGRVYGKSGWEVLIQDPKDDPKSGQKTAQPQRTRYLPLDAVQPTAADNWIKEELTDTAVDCRSALDIVWVDGDIDMQIVIDRSGSMRGSAISYARQAANLLVDATAEGTTSLGVVAFSSSVTQNSEIQAIPSPGAVVKESIKQTIDAIYASGSTALYDGAHLALENLNLYQSTEGSGAPGVVFVLADGDDNSSYISEADVITEYQNANIPIFTFGYGSASPTGPLLSLANGTGGKYFSSPTTLAEITDAFLQANALATDSQNLADASSDIPGSSNADFDLVVDSGIANISLFLSHSGNVDDITYSITDANGDSVSATNECISLSGGVSCSANIDSTTINSAATGIWQVSVTNNAMFELPVSFNASGEPSENGTYNVTVEGASGNSVVYPEPLILTTAITKDRAITGVNVTASISSPFSAETQIKMVDDGTSGDGIAGDGIYSAIVGYKDNGVYQVTVYVDNDDSNAVFTSVGLLTPAEDGSQPQAPVLPSIQENFFRVSKASLVVSDVPFNDGDDSTSGATIIVPDNTGIDSQINTTFDADYYQANDIDLTQPVFVRVTDLSLGMLPKISVLTEDGSTEVVTDATLSDSISATGYLYTEIPQSKLTSTMYLVVEHEDENASQGGYQVSMGPKLNTDVPPNNSPEAGDDSSSVFAGYDVTIAILDNDSDADGDSVSVDSIDSSGALGTLTLNDDGTVTFVTANAYAALTAGDQIVEEMTYVVSDGEGGFSKGIIAITVKANSPPNANSDNVELDEVSEIVISPLANDTDDDGHTLTLKSVDIATLKGELTDNNDGTYSYNPNGVFNALKVGETDEDNFTYVVSDELGAESIGTVTITINGVNQTPVANADAATVGEAGTVNIEVLSNDTDPDGDVLSASSIVTDATKGTVTINDDGSITYSANNQFNSLDTGETAIDTFSYVLSDGTETVSAVVTVTINGATDAKESSGGGGAFSLFWVLSLGLLAVFRRTTLIGRF
jgi:VCBS repeat-containing protein